MQKNNPLSRVRRTGGAICEGRSDCEVGRLFKKERVWMLDRIAGIERG
ncbi:hypothetical protein [Paenibacillus albus]|nr:hypothetical protein [Paenibacillus albus]